MTDYLRYSHYWAEWKTDLDIPRQFLSFMQSVWNGCVPWLVPFLFTPYGKLCRLCMRCRHGCCNVKISFEFEFYGPVNTVKVMLSRSINLLVLFSGHCPLSCCTFAYTFASDWQLPFFNQWKRENDRRNDIMINLHESGFCGQADFFICDPLIWSQTRYRMRLEARLLQPVK